MEKIARNKVELLYNVVNRIDFKTVSDKNVRRQLIGLIPQLARLIKQRKEDLEEIRKKLFDGFKQEDLNAHDKFVDEVAKCKNTEEAKRLEVEKKEKFPEITKALETFQEEIKNYGEGEVELSVDAIDAESFIEALNEQPFPIDGSLLSALQPIVKL